MESPRTDSAQILTVDNEDTSRNSFLLSLISNGEGWHNNHHHYQASMRNGFFWWEWDPSGYVVRALGRIGLVWDIRKVPRVTLLKNRIRDGVHDVGMLGKKAAALLPDPPMKQAGEQTGA